MTLLFCDGFDHYAFADRLTKWTSLVNVNTGSMQTGRFGSGQAMLIGSGTVQNAGMNKTLPGYAGSSTVIIGAAVKLGGLVANTFFRLIDTGGTAHVDVRWNTSGNLLVTRAGTTLATGTTVLSTSFWYYIELKTTIHDTTGSFELRINGNVEVSGTNVDTRNAGTGLISRFTLGTVSGGNTSLQVDDFYFCDNAGSVNNDFLGDLRVLSILPNNNGNSSQLVGSDLNSTDNYLLVDEATPSTADYVQSSTVGEKDTYAFGDVSSSGTVYGVQLVPYVAKTDAGDKSIVSVARLSGAETDGPVQTLLSTPSYMHDVRETKPGGGAWSVSDVNSAEFGIKVNA